MIVVKAVNSEVLSRVNSGVLFQQESVWSPASFDSIMALIQAGHTRIYEKHPGSGSEPSNSAAA